MSTKGSWSRVSNHKAYNDNWDRIFNSPKLGVMDDISLAMSDLILWAKAYDEGGDEVVEDFVYDAQVRQLQRLEKEHPNEWQECLKIYPEFEDGSWKYTGMFYRGSEE